MAGNAEITRSIRSRTRLPRAMAAADAITAASTTTSSKAGGIQAVGPNPVYPQGVWLPMP
jgi:hypothetical protein